jgi:hypothetical protein
MYCKLALMTKCYIKNYFKFFIVFKNNKISSRKEMRVCVHEKEREREREREREESLINSF